MNAETTLLLYGMAASFAGIVVGYILGRTAKRS